jgi:hypothetical protein
LEDEMPVEYLGYGKYKYGEHGKVYTGKNAEEKAEIQGRAIHASESRTIKVKPSSRARGYVRR